LRSGTENMPGIVGLAAAIENNSPKSNSQKVSAFRDYLEKELAKSIKNIKINFCDSPRLPNHLSITFEGENYRNYVKEYNEQGICLSSGSACSEKTLSGSHVLGNLGFNSQKIHSTVRVTLGLPTTKNECNMFLHATKFVTNYKNTH
jgi:cysteine desulfurase